MIDSASCKGLSLGFVGDICLSLDVINVVRERGTEYPFELIRPRFDQFDLVIGNLECYIADDGNGTSPTGPPLYVPVDVAEALTQSGIDVFGLANNHVFDGGALGLRSTHNYLNRNGFRHFGAGMSLEEAEAPLYLKIAGRCVAFLGACDVSAFWADRNTGGIAPLTDRRLVRRVDKAKEMADLVIVVLHADVEFTRHPAPYRQRLCRRLIDHGAAMIIQHHPHVCQGIEHYNGGLIAYSLGNHVFQVANNKYQQHHTGTDESMLLQVDIDFSGSRPRLDVAVHPLVIGQDHRPVPCEPRPAIRMRERIDELSRELGNDRLVRGAWRQTCGQQVRNHVFDSYYTLRRDGIGQTLRNQVRLLRKPERRRWIYGFLSAGML